MNNNLKRISIGVLFFVGLTEINAQDTIRTTTIDPVIVVGYQKKLNSQVTSAVAQVGEEDLAKMAPATSVSNMIQGKMAGVSVTASSGKPGSGAQLQIRGISTLTFTPGAGQPLIVVDGNVLGNDATAQFLLNSIPPENIETISALKDAAAAAIYGAQGGSGVIVVVTKGGKKGKPVISYSSKMGFAEKIKDINFSMMNSRQKIEYEQNLFALGASGYYSWPDQAEIDDAISMDHDWQKDLTRNAFIQSHNIAIRAGNSNTTYSGTLSYDEDNGIIERLEGFKRLGGRFKLDSKVNDKFDFGFSFGGTYRKVANQRDRNNVQNPIRAMYSYLPYDPVRLANGEYNPTFAGFNVLNALEKEPSTNQNVITDATIYGAYKILPSLTYRLQGSGVYNAAQADSRVLRGSELDRILGIQSSSKNFNNDFLYTLTNTLNFNKQFGKHDIDILALAELQENYFNFVSAQGRSFSSPSLSEISNTSTPFATSGFDTHRKTFGYGLFATYDFDKRYILTGSVRQDADSRFGRNNVFSVPFYSASVAWNVTNENFLKDNNYLNNLKLRASYGTRGNNNIPNGNQVLVSGGSVGPTPFPTLSASGRVGNPDLKWEEVASLNLGAEFGFFNNRLTGTFDYFKDERKDFVLDVPNISVTGGSYSGLINAGDLSNHGVEISANLDILRNWNGLSWSIKGNASFLDYKLNRLVGTETERIIDGLNILREGFEPNLFYLVRSAGIDQTDGKELYFDKDGNVTRNYSTDDRVALDGKSPNPDYYGGFGTSISYKGFDASADFSFKGGNYSYNFMALSMLNYSNGANDNMRVDAIDFWTPSNTNASLPAPGPTDNGIAGLQATDRFLQDASYIRFRNASIGYTINKASMGYALPFNKIRFSITGQNLATWTKFEGDPEVGIGSGENQTGAGQTFVSGAYAQYSYPAVRTFLFGLDLEF